MHGQVCSPAAGAAQNWSEKDSAPLISDKPPERLRSFGTKAKDPSAKGRVGALPGRAQPRKWMRIDAAGALSYIAVSLFLGPSMANCA